MFMIFMTPGQKTRFATHTSGFEGSHVHVTLDTRAELYKYLLVERNGTQYLVVMPSHLVRDIELDDCRMGCQDRLKLIKLLKDFPHLPPTHLGLAEYVGKYINRPSDNEHGGVVYRDYGYMAIRGRSSWFHVSPSTTVPGSLVEGVLGTSGYRVSISRDPNDPLLFY